MGSFPSFLWTLLAFTPPKAECFSRNPFPTSHPLVLKRAETSASCSSRWRPQDALAAHSAEGAAGPLPGFPPPRCSCCPSESPWTVPRAQGACWRLCRLGSGWRGPRRRSPQRRCRGCLTPAGHRAREAGVATSSAWWDKEGKELQTEQRQGAEKGAEENRRLTRVCSLQFCLKRRGRPDPVLARGPASSFSMQHAWV